MRLMGSATPIAIWLIISQGRSGVSDKQSPSSWGYLVMCNVPTKYSRSASRLLSVLFGLNSIVAHKL